ncbi:hypothetical protein ASPCAL11656 [Aspergillus calidoustus]|uniref:Uncharacterized protein n=1 Tax=Aspergillus calidoustus TaxID=454130 RepID=A0A0U5GA33_ASPCI|nr:hypothetical protein ASPCAL11656 [Aspergillus calidoustus]
MSHHAADGICSEDWPDLTDRAGQKLCEGLDTGVRILEDGRLDIKLSDHKPWIQRIVRHTKEHPYPSGHPDHKPSVTFCPNEEESYPLRLNIVIQVIGSRGDIQPFLAIGQRLQSHGHRVRLATHLSFRETVQDSGLEFFNIGGDPAELMAFMVKNPGLLPGMRTIRSGAIRKRRREMRTIFSGCWRSCFEMGDGTGIEHHVPSDPWNSDEVDYRHVPFVADVVIANPPSFAHLSCVEKLGVALNLMFTMPWSATQAFPHPLANIRSKNTKPSVANFASYAIVEIMLWEGLGDLINRFRKRELGLDPLDALRAPSIAHRLRIPYTYLWSPALLPKPLDWPPNIDVVGFSTLPESSYTPPSDLDTFLSSGPPPIYIGFGSIVVDNPSHLTNLVFTAIRRTGHRALVSRGWGNIGADQPPSEDILMIDKVPHDWLFHHVSCVVHHGGAGTTAAGLIRGRPTVIVPFFGDQMFWGGIVYRARAGPAPIPYKQLTADKLADAIEVALKDETLSKAEELGAQMRDEEGARNAVCSFYRHLDVKSLQCDICPGRPAAWWVQHSRARKRPGGVKLSAFAATVLVETGLLKPHELVLYRSKEYDTSRDPKGPLSAGAEVLYGVVTDFVSAMAEMPNDVAEMIRAHGSHGVGHGHSGEHRHLKHGQRPPNPVREWKKRHFAIAKMDSGGGSSDASRADGERDGRDSSVEGSLGEDNSRRNSSASRSNSSSNSDAATESSYASAPSTPIPQPQSPPLASIAAAISRAPTNQEPDLTNELTALSLESTLRRQQSREKSVQIREILTDARYHATRAGKHLLNWVLLLPTDLALSFSKGFHNAPKLYHDPMVQETPTVRGVKGGFRAAGTEFTQEFCQGITGLVKQPKYGRKEGGTKGMIKGVGKGVGGVILKPAAGLWGLIGYPLDGIHKTLRNSLGKSKVKDILASRIRQGLGEMVAATPEERAAVIRRWNEIQKENDLHNS